ncbi:FecR family protein [Yunchengibacter salinarum]|uniref:FecR family protein n=1 Tax=Yunchengibacter salinarum TaxID=3133399 RepID=UPI0035B621A6
MKQQRRLREEAAYWCVTMADPAVTRLTKARFAEWITRSPAHLREYAATESLWEETARQGEALDPENRVVPLFPGRALATPGVRRAAAFRGMVKGVLRAGSRRPAAGLAGAAALVLLLVGSLLLNTPTPLTETNGTYDTVRGETRVISLADGSVLHLNTASRVRVAFEPEQRSVRLDHGQAYFKVAKDAERPFVVQVDDRQVRAVGTAFDVKAFDADMTVTVVEGEVLVSDPGAEAETDKGGDDRPVRPVEADSPATGAGRQVIDPVNVVGWSTSLKANERLVVARNAPIPRARPTRVQAHQETAWRQNMLIFSKDRLARVVADFNRYNRTRLLLPDDRIGDLKVSGTFDPRDPRTFARTIATAAGLSVSRGPGGHIVLRPGPEMLTGSRANTGM